MKSFHEIHLFANFGDAVNHLGYLNVAHTFKFDSQSPEMTAQIVMITRRFHCPQSSNVKWSSGEKAGIHLIIFDPLDPQSDYAKLELFNFSEITNINSSHFCSRSAVIL